MMVKSISPVKAPFYNLKSFMIITKILGLISCKLVNGRLRPSDIWGHCYCVLWIIIHCSYTSVVYYDWYIDITPSNKINTFFVLDIVRYNCFFLSLVPYHYMAIFRSRDFVNFSNKLETYDDKATMLGHRRKEKHLLIWICFVSLLSMLILKTYLGINHYISYGSMEVLKIMFNYVLPTITGTCTVFITVIYLDIIRQRFRHLNKSIVPRVSHLPVTGSQGEITVYDVRYLHGVLIDSAELINDIYGICTLFVMCSILLEFTSVIYLYIKRIDRNNPVVVILDLFFQTICIILAYHLTALEANQTEERIKKYGLSSQDEKSRMDQIEMMLYFYHMRFNFTASDFFILNLAIFFSIFSAITTFITIII